MLQETYLSLLNEELNNLQRYVEDRKLIFHETLVNPSKDTNEKSLKLSLLISDCSQRITFYEKQLYDLGFYSEAQDETKLNQTLTGNC